MIDYNIVKITDLGTVNRGKSKHRPRNDSILYGGEYPFIQTADVKKANLYLSDYSQTYNELGLKQSKLWKKGTLCFTIAANIADSAILDVDACFPDSIVGFLPYENVSDTTYVKYLFDELKLYFQQISKGTTQDNLSLDKICRVKLRVPNYETQKKIASVLSTYDNLIENNNKRIKLLEQMAEKLYKEWFVRFRFPGYEGIAFEEKKPRGWREVRLREFGINLESGSRPKGGIDSSAEEGIPSLGAEAVNGLAEFDFNNVKLIPAEFYKKLKRGKNKGNHILIYKDGAYIGKTTLFKYDFPFNEYAINEHVFFMNSIREEYQNYLFFTLKQSAYFTIMQNLNRNAAQPGLSQLDINRIKILEPDKDIVIRFNHFIEPLLKEVFQLAKENQTLLKQRDMLLPRLMSGKLEV